MNKINWETNLYKTIGKYRVPSVSNLIDGYNQGSGIKRTSKTKLMLKRIFWPLVKLRNDLMIDGFIEWEIGKLIKKYITTNSVFLEIGCGDMSLRKYVPSNFWYNALDLEISDFHIMRVLKRTQRVNLIIASATEIPAPPNSASLIVSTETFEHIPEIDRVIEEIYRIATPDAILILSIPNNYCYKYEKKGPHLGHINNWKYHEFIEYMKSYHFEFVEGFMKGYWVPFPLWITKKSYQLPISSKKEYYNTNFFFVFRTNK